MANLTCSITSLSDLLDKADRNLLNLTTTIASCPGICSLAWGKGNPDLSGIGAMISYIMQGVLTFLCGPVIGLLYRLVSNESTQRRLSEVTHLFLEISVGFNIPVAIAAAFHMAQSPPYFDQFSMSSLLGTQLMSFFSVMLTSMSFEESHLSPNSPTTLFYLGLQLLLLGVVGTVQSWPGSDYSRASLRQLLEDCKSYSQITPYRVPSAEEWSTAWAVVQKSLWFMVALLAVLLVFLILLTSKIIRDLVIRKLRRSGNIRNILPELKFRLGFQMLMIAAMIYLLYAMESSRNKFKAIVGPDFQDDQWGFGQIVAVYLWIPLCLKIIYDVLYIIWDHLHLGWVNWIKDKISQMEGTRNNHIDCGTQTIDNCRISEIKAETQTPIENRKLVDHQLGVMAGNDGNISEAV